MWRYLAGGGAVAAMAGAGLLLFSGHAERTTPLLPERPAGAAADAVQDPLPDRVPEASDRTREQKRFDRYDKNRDGSVTRDEYLMQRRKAFAKLDANHDGTLSFDEWAVKAEAKFAGADADRSGAMTAAEFATTAVKRKTRVQPRCPPGRTEES